MILNLDDSLYHDLYDIILFYLDEYQVISSHSVLVNSAHIILDKLDNKDAVR